MLYEKFMQSWNSQDITGYFSCFHDDYQMILRSFAEVFPDCIIFFTGFDTILLGAKNNQSFDNIFTI